MKEKASHEPDGPVALILGVVPVPLSPTAPACLGHSSGKVRTGVWSCRWGLSSLSGDKGDSVHWFSVSPLAFFKKFLMFILFMREIETELEWGEGQRERETQNPRQAPGSELSAQSPMQGSNPQTMRS